MWVSRRASAEMYLFTRVHVAGAQKAPHKKETQSAAKRARGAQPARRRWVRGAQRSTKNSLRATCARANSVNAPARCRPNSPPPARSRCAVAAAPLPVRSVVARRRPSSRALALAAHSATRPPQRALQHANGQLSYPTVPPPNRTLSSNTPLLRRTDPTCRSARARCCTCPSDQRVRCRVASLFLHLPPVPFLATTPSPFAQPTVTHPPHPPSPRPTQRKTKKKKKNQLIFPPR